MENQKKLQIFISSTYTDLLAERQTAVEAVLEAGHIPAGMELFAASDKSQWEIIERWIDESDIYLLILGGRYGSIEKNSGKSYTHLEYEYAQSKNKPLFAIVIDEAKLNTLQVKDSEIANPDKLKDFRDIVLEKMSSFFSDNKDIKLEIHRSLNRIRQDYKLSGWIRGDKNNSDLAKEMVILNDEIRKLRAENVSLKAEQIKRLPNLKVSINNSQNVELKLQIDESVFYKIRERIDSIPEHLNDYLTQQEVDAYNKSLSNIDQSKINEFNEVVTKIHTLMIGQKRFEVNLSNVGTIKANNIYITITFPDLLLVTDSQKEISQVINELNHKLQEIIPRYDFELISEAETRYKENLKVDSEGYINRKLENALNNISRPPAKHYLPWRNRSDDKKNYDSSERNTITIVKSELMHSLTTNYTGYKIFPLKKGTDVIKVKVICEEYLEPIFYEIPITIS